MMKFGIVRRRVFNRARKRAGGGDQELERVGVGPLRYWGPNV